MLHTAAEGETATKDCERGGEVRGAPPRTPLGLSPQTPMRNGAPLTLQVCLDYVPFTVTSALCTHAHSHSHKRKCAECKEPRATQAGKPTAARAAARPARDARCVGTRTRGRRVARARGPDPRSQKREGAHARLAGWVELERASGESCRRGRANPPGTPVGGPRPRAPPVLPGVADAGSKPHAAARVGKRGEMALHEGASLARAGSDARSICGAQVGGRRLSRAWEQVPRAGGGRDAGGPPSATRATTLSVGVEERGRSPTSRRT